MCHFFVFAKSPITVDLLVYDPMTTTGHRLQMNSLVLSRQWPNIDTQDTCRMPSACKQVFSDIKVGYRMGRFLDVVRRVISVRHIIKCPAYPTKYIAVTLVLRSAIFEQPRVSNVHWLTHLERNKG